MSTWRDSAKALSSGVAAIFRQRAEFPRVVSDERPNRFPKAVMAASGSVVEWMTSSVMMR
jgi:hypothetical protein